jgi:Flp pilus assembly protein TadD
MWRKPLIAVLLALATLVVYCALRPSGFLGLDDPTYGTTNALEHLSESLPQESQYPQAHFARGMNFATSGNLDGAGADFQEAIRLKPDFYQAYFQLGKVRALQSRFEEARTNFLKAVSLKPDYAEAQTLLGNVLQLQGQRAEAILHLRAAVAVQPNYGEGRYFLANALTYQHNLPEAAAQLEVAIKLKPDFAPALKDLAFILIAPDNPGLRNVARGVQLAEQACKLTAYEDPVYLQAYASALAEAGSFPEAVQQAQKALKLALAKGDAAMVSSLSSLLTRFQAGQPDRENPR